MNLIAIASLGEGNKVAYDAAGNRYFIPETFRKAVKAGNFAITAEKTFSSRTDNEEGSATFGQVVACDPWKRTDITFLSANKLEAIKIKAESKLLAAEEDAYVAQQSAALKTTYSVDNLQPA